MRRKPRLGTIFIGFGIFISLTLVFAFPLRTIFMRSIVTPLIDSILVLRWYVHRLPQLMLWIILIIAGSIIAMRFLTRAFPFPKRRKTQRYSFSKPDARSDLQQLCTLIDRSSHHTFARRRIASELAPLCIRLIAHRERLQLGEASKRFKSFQWCDDEAVKTFFDFRQPYHSIKKGKAFRARLDHVVSFLERYYQGV